MTNRPSDFSSGPRHFSIARLSGLLGGEKTEAFNSYTCTTMPPLRTKPFDGLFITCRDIYFAEKQIEKSLPDMIEKVGYPALKQGFQTHLGETKGQIQRLEEVFKMHGVEAKGIDCPAIDGKIDGILEEADDVAGEVDDKAVLDAALVAAA